ncbi:hypothetical protein [Flavobacterium wongokense]|uniref:hypothetical protein n=1 Tax=Flavobacterium wongokense TaxID=2910674 RepID=UPI001F28423E|nr:hypothetical protein [Flavobacterium sp. WG47]MCF6130904.1 hypothetical protein [Flavobacterium sp. WG47]
MKLNLPIKLIIIVALMSLSKGYSQKDCYPDCNIKMEEVKSMRNPTITGVLPECKQEIQDRLNQYAQEDANSAKQLRNVACSYASGWVEKSPGACNAGGPPPCCPIDHWYKSGNAWDAYVAQNKEVYDRRKKQCDDINNACIKDRDDQIKAENEKREQLAQQQQQEAQARADAQAEAWKQQQEAERLRLEEAARQAELARLEFIAEQQRIQDQLNTNDSVFKDAMNQNNAETQAKLDEFDKNSGLGDIENDDSKGFAENLLNSVNTENEGDSAFGTDSILNSKYALETSGTSIGNAIEEYTTKVVDYAKEKISEVSPLFDNVNKVYDAIESYQSNLNVFNRSNGGIKKEDVDLIFSFYPNSLANEHRQQKQHEAIDLGDGISNVTTAIGSGSDEDIQNEANKFTSYFTDTPKVESKPLTANDYKVAARAFVGGALFIAAGGPAWVAIGGAAWYVFKN